MDAGHEHVVSMDHNPAYTWDHGKIFKVQNSVKILPTDKKEFLLAQLSLQFSNFISKSAALKTLPHFFGGSLG